MNGNTADWLLCCYSLLTSNWTRKDHWWTQDSFIGCLTLLVYSFAQYVRMNNHFYRQCKWGWVLNSKFMIVVVVQSLHKRDLGGHIEKWSISNNIHITHSFSTRPKKNCYGFWFAVRICDSRRIGQYEREAIRALLLIVDKFHCQIVPCLRIVNLKIFSPTFYGQVNILWHFSRISVEIWYWNLVAVFQAIMFFFSFMLQFVFGWPVALPDSVWNLL